MEFGVHLPQIGWEDREPAGLDRLIAVATAAERLGFGTITANDHLVYGRPWLDGPTALAAVLVAAPTVRLMTSVSLPVVRGPFVLAKTLGALDMLSGGRLDAGLGPGSSEADYRLARIPFAERWARFDEAVGAMRALWDADAAPFTGRFYDTSGVGRFAAAAGATRPDRRSGSAAGDRPPAYVAWPGSGTAGSRPATTRPRNPSRGSGSRSAACSRRRAAIRPPSRPPWPRPGSSSPMRRRRREPSTNVWARCSVGPSRRLVGRLPIGSPAACLDLMGRYRDAGLRRILVWPMRDEVEQLERVAAEIIPNI